MVLQVVEPCCALYVGKRFRYRELVPFEYLSTRNRILELPHELFKVVLHDAV
ncbi:hypothetical protein X942_5493 [Burkholderia pseudomallei MSHR5596]|nr:hypothetical protein X942_5493 [Burkholderia pseudomallei MSHR5596]